MRIAGRGVVLLRPNLAFEDDFADLLRFRDLKARWNVLLSWGDICALDDLAFGSIDLNNTNSFRLGSDPRPCIADPVFGHTHQQKRRPTQENMGSDPVGDATVHRPQIKRGLESAKGVLDFEQLLVAQGHVFRR